MGHAFDAGITHAEGTERHSKHAGQVVRNRAEGPAFWKHRDCRHHLAFSAPAKVTAANIAGGDRKEIAGVRGSLIDTGPVLDRRGLVWSKP